MQYALLIYQAGEVLDHFSRSDQKDALTGHRLLEQAKAEGVFVTADELMLSSTPATVQERTGKTLILDGRFAET